MSNLTECKDCGHSVSKRAAICPSCGVSWPGRDLSPVVARIKTAFLSLDAKRVVRQGAKCGAVVASAFSLFVMLVLLDELDVAEIVLGGTFAWFIGIAGTTVVYSILVLARDFVISLRDNR